MPDVDPVVNCVFPVQGWAMPREHGYALYGALHQVWPDLETYTWLQVGPITPLVRRQGLTVVGREATLLLRAPVSQLATLFVLAETTHRLDQGTIALGRPWITPLQASPVLYSPFVTVKVHKPRGGLYPWDELCLSRFATGIEARLAAAGIVAGRAHIEIRTPRVLHIQEGGASGWPVAVLGLTDVESLHLQTVGLGGRRKMGCGVLMPWPSP